MALGIPQQIVTRGYQSRGGQLLLTQGYFAAEEPEQNPSGFQLEPLRLNIERTHKVTQER